MAELVAVGPPQSGGASAIASAERPIEQPLEVLNNDILQAAIDVHLAGGAAEAAPIYQRFVDAAFPNSVAYTNLAAIRLDQGREPEAIILWRQALELRQDLPDTWFDLGNAMLRQQQNEQARA